MYKEDLGKACKDHTLQAFLFFVKGAMISPFPIEHQFPH